MFITQEGNSLYALSSVNKEIISVHMLHKDRRNTQEKSKILDKELSSCKYRSKLNKGRYLKGGNIRTMRLRVESREEGILEPC
jgi:hypothetical protein